MCPRCASSCAARTLIRPSPSDSRHAPGESARVRPSVRPGRRAEDDDNGLAQCPAPPSGRLFSRGDIDRRALQSAPPPSATGVREAPPKCPLLFHARACRAWSGRGGLYQLSRRCGIGGMSFWPECSMHGACMHTQLCWTTALLMSEFYRAAKVACNR